MRAFVINLSLLICVITCISSSCDRKKNNSKNDCSEDVICTMMFAMVNIHITDNNGQDVVLDNVYTVRKANNDTVRHEQNMMNASYIVLDDSYVKKLQNNSDTFFFYGIKNGTLLVNEPFAISADCCHVNKQSGKAELQLP